MLTKNHLQVIIPSHFFFLSAEYILCSSGTVPHGSDFDGRHLVSAVLVVCIAVSQLMMVDGSFQPPPMPLLLMHTFRNGSWPLVSFSVVN